MVSQFGFLTHFILFIAIFSRDHYVIIQEHFLYIKIFPFHLEAESEMKAKCKSISNRECCPESHHDWIWMCEQGCSGFWSLSAVECRLWMSCSLPQSFHSHIGIWEWVLAASKYLQGLCRKRSHRYSVNMIDLQFLCSCSLTLRHRK